ncbi:hypothetical protein [Paracraurococcus lichenis]|uniref:Uncharacterized protein n=1 Tax=Paracraurococcus lichenis TaxID=3064888 RepID=A0ABT9DYB6_9PROT|nr:hypothetical protein [Paracraurococcus sp. LOR1-02]MDO9708874.1 hypothetical protein [Paracraurococcus sp. LOR1-02]
MSEKLDWLPGLRATVVADGESPCIYERVLKLNPMHMSLCDQDLIALEPRIPAFHWGDQTVLQVASELDDSQDPDGRIDFAQFWNCGLSAHFVGLLLLARRLGCSWVCLTPSAPTIQELAVFPQYQVPEDRCVLAAPFEIGEVVWWRGAKYEYVGVVPHLGGHTFASPNDTAVTFDDAELSEALRNYEFCSDELGPECSLDSSE